MSKLNAHDNIGGRVNKTSICSVVFIDIIDCSLKPVSEQIEDKECFNALLSEAIKNVAESDRIILDTGDGAAIALMGAPEDALFAALVIRDGIIQHNRESSQQLYVRIGINLGPVIVVNDINGRLNILGDGINVAQRVMSFAESNQVMVSRSYYEVTSRLTKEITGMFVYSGIKHDKHVREHEVYSIQATDQAASLAAYHHRQDPPPPKASRQHFIHRHWLALAVACFAAVVFGLLGLSRLVSNDAGRLPISADNQEQTTLAAGQGMVPPSASALQSTVFVDAAVAPSAPDNAFRDDVSQQNADSNNKRPAAAAAPKDSALNKKSTRDKKIKQDEIITRLDPEPAQKPAAEPQAAEVEKKEQKQLSWQGLTKSFKQGSQDRECTQAEKVLNQCPR